MDMTTAATEKKILPGYIKYFFILGSVIMTIIVILVARTIISPMLTAAVLAVLLNPLCVKFEKLGLSRLLSVTVTIILMFVSVFLIFTYFSTQIASITTTIPNSETRLTEIISSSKTWTANLFGTSTQSIVSFLNNLMKTLWENSSSFFQGLLNFTLGFFAAILLFAISLFFFLYYRSFLLQFLYKCVDESKETKVAKTLAQMNASTKKYIVGLATVILIVACLNTLSLLLLGIENAIFFGFFAAILLIVPYVGILIGSLVPFLFALATKDSAWYAVGVVIAFSFVQFLEGNFITPNIVGQNLNINPFAAILGLFVGGMLLGVMGVILIIPILGITKIICDQNASLRPIGFLLGNPPRQVTIQQRLESLWKRITG